MLTEAQVLKNPVNPETKWLLSVAAQREMLASMGLREVTSGQWSTLERIPKSESDGDFGNRADNFLQLGEIDQITLREANEFTANRNIMLLPEFSNRRVTVEEVLRVWRSS